ncbi:MAG: tRNA pseudouridine(38-40) synthase TruA [Hyphomicrobiales bacterium]|nr:tRNA pseudouridine(38-40) synthase TruA [Hyphomicrobiales bacterium]
MARHRLVVEYDGAGFVGWHRQANGRSVQEALEAAVRSLTGAEAHVQGAGRTDAGVHAIAQVAHVDLAAAWRGDKLRDALNAHLRPISGGVAVTAAEPAAEEFHARHSAIRRRYVYRIANRRAPLALERGRVWHVRARLDADAMGEAARSLLGSHDFSTFRDAECQAASPVRTLDRLDVTRTGEEIVLRAEARSFLHRQVRSMVGTLVEVGAGRWRVGDVAAALEARDRARCGRVAPAEGLYLEGVDYA